MPSFGLLGLLERLRAGVNSPAAQRPTADGRVRLQQLAPLLRGACWFKLLLLSLVFAIALRWSELLPALLCLCGLYLATEALCSLLAPWQAAPLTGATEEGALDLDGALRSEVILSGGVLLLCVEPWLHLPPAVILPLLMLVALLLQLGLYGPMVALLQLAQWGREREQAHSGVDRRGCRWQRLAGRLLGLWQALLSMALLLLAGALVLHHLPGLDELLGYLQMELGFYALPGPWLWSLYLGVGLLAGLWGRWLLTVRRYFAPAASSRQGNKKNR